MMAEAAATWEQLSESAKDAFGWAAAVERGGSVGTRGVLIGIMRAHDDGEPDQLLRHFGSNRDELFHALQQANPAAPLEPETNERTSLVELPRLTANAKQALDLAARLRADTDPRGPLETRHLFGGMLRAKRGTAYRGLASLGSVPAEELAESYVEYLKTDPPTRYRDHLRQRYPSPDRVDWISDATARDDLLRRKPLAASLATRLDRIQQAAPASSFLVHVDGPWGSGKSTLLDFLEEELRSHWLVVRYDAWRQARVGPPWWTLLIHLRLALAATLSRRERVAMRTAEAWSRIRVAGAVYALTLVVLVAAALGLFFVLRPDELGSTTAGDVARSVTAVVTAVGALVGGALVASRFLLWESARGARVYEEIQTNPMESLANHFAFLIDRARRPVIFFVDDLDRCDEARVVDVLDSIQTLVRDVPKLIRRRRQDAALAPFFVVAAEGAWIRKSYERAHEGLAAAVAEPGRPLGYLFLEKVFQLTVTVPTLSPHGQGDFLRALLQGRERKSLEDELARERKRLEESTSEAAVVETLRNARPELREELAGEAVKKLTERGVDRELEHELQRFAVLLERNPRSMKRFVNAYGVERAVRLIEGNFVETGPLALWTILRSRWPDLADYLASKPEAIEAIGEDARPPNDALATLTELFSSPDVISVVHCQDGGPLTPALVAACCGTALRGTTG